MRRRVQRESSEEEERKPTQHTRNVPAGRRMATAVVRATGRAGACTTKSVELPVARVMLLFPTPMLRKTLLILAAVLVAIQFIRPARNDGSVAGPHFIGTQHPVPPAVQQVLAAACYDCHSNQTRYPWYARVQPVGWWLAQHVNDGKRHLNFSEFTTYTTKRAGRKLDECLELVKEGEMPLSSYTWMHQDARLNAEQKALVLAWLAEVRKTVPASENSR